MVSVGPRHDKGLVTVIGSTQHASRRLTCITSVEQVQVVEVSNAVAAAKHEESIADSRRSVTRAGSRHRARRDRFAPRQNRLRCAHQVCTPSRHGARERERESCM
jgi:hypothetical protein